MEPQPVIAVIGTGVIGCAVAWALAREGHAVVMLDPESPGTGGASYGNVGHIAAELVEPLPSPQLLFGFWRELFAFGGALDIAPARLGRVALWGQGFAAAAFRRGANTRHLAPLVRPAAGAWQQLLSEVGAAHLLRCRGHYQVWHGRSASARAETEARHMDRLAVPTRPAAAQVAQALAAAGGDTQVAVLEFPESAHVLDPRGVCEALAHGATQRGATLIRMRVQQLRARGELVEVRAEGRSIQASAVVVCAGVWSRALLANFGLRCPLECVRGYHLELPDHPPLVDAPLVYCDDSTVVTPMAGRLRASSFMEFTRPEAPSDPRKVARLRQLLARRGYRCEAAAASWVGPRPVLPDYLPAIGRVGTLPVFYAFGHQHIGLTLAPVTADLIAALVAGRTPPHPVAAFDLRRFGGLPAASSVA